MICRSSAARIGRFSTCEKSYNSCLDKELLRGTTQMTDFFNNGAQDEIFLERPPVACLSGVLEESRFAPR